MSSETLVKYMIKPVRKKMIQAMDDLHTYMIASIGSVLLMLGSILLFAIKIENFYVSLIITGICGLIYSMAYFNSMSAEQDKITDITHNFIELDPEDKTLVCYQTAGDFYETCCIYFDDILSVTESTGKNQCSFILHIKSGIDRKSSVQINNMITGDNVIEIKGGLYDTDKFIDLYRRFVDVLPDTVTVHKRTSQKNWYTKTRTEKRRYLLSPWIITFISLLLQFFVFDQLFPGIILM